MEEQHGNSGPSRLDRIESLLERLVGDHLTFRDEHRALLTAQVLLTDRQVLLTDRMDRLTGTMQELAESQKHTDERMGILIHMMDEFIRTRGEQRG
jgi:hypothetical protein